MVIDGKIGMAFTDRHTMVSLAPREVKRLGMRAHEVRQQARNAVAMELGLSPGRVVYMNQAHGTNVQYVEEPFGDSPPPVDAVFTDRLGLGLAVLVADCAPVLVADPAAGLIGAAHAGRRGAVAGVVSNLIAAMVSHGANPSRITAFIGPSICARCYEVSDLVHAEVAMTAPHACSATPRGTPSLDIRALVVSQLRRAGVTHVRHDWRCTYETPELYSYRREGPTGDFAGYVWLSKAHMTHLRPTCSDPMWISSKTHPNPSLPNLVLAQTKEDDFID